MDQIDTAGMPRVLTEGKTPAQWVEFLAEHGLEVSERTLREKARSSGHFYSLGKAMILMPEHIDRIFEEAPRRAKQVDFSNHSTSIDRLMASTVAVDEARKHLESRASKRKKKR